MNTAGLGGKSDGYNNDDDAQTESKTRGLLRPRYQRYEFPILAEDPDSFLRARTDPLACNVNNDAVIVWNDVIMSPCDQAPCEVSLGKGSIEDVFLELQNTAQVYHNYGLGEKQKDPDSYCLESSSNRGGGDEEDEGEDYANRGHATRTADGGKRVVEDPVVTRRRLFEQGRDDLYGHKLHSRFKARGGGRSSSRKDSSFTFTDESVCSEHHKKRQNSSSLALDLDDIDDHIRYSNSNQLHTHTCNNDFLDSGHFEDMSVDLSLSPSNKGNNLDPESYTLRYDMDENSASGDGASLSTTTATEISRTSSKFDSTTSCNDDKSYDVHTSEDEDNLDNEISTTIDFSPGGEYADDVFVENSSFLDTKQAYSSQHNLYNIHSKQNTSENYQDSSMLSSSPDRVTEEYKNLPANYVYVDEKCGQLQNSRRDTDGMVEYQIPSTAGSIPNPSPRARQSSTSRFRSRRNVHTKKSRKRSSSSRKAPNRTTADGKETTWRDEACIPVRCQNRSCGKISSLVDARKTYKNCHHCLKTYYCSRECRREDWLRHKEHGACPGSRVSSACKKVIRYCNSDPDVKSVLSRLAMRGYLAHGRGCVMLGFPDLQCVEDFLEYGFPMLELNPIYVSCRELAVSKMYGNVLENLLDTCRTYKPQAKFVLNVGVGLNLFNFNSDFSCCCFPSCSSSSSPSCLQKHQRHYHHRQHRGRLRNNDDNIIDSRERSRSQDSDLGYGSMSNSINLSKDNLLLSSPTSRGCCSNSCSCSCSCSLERTSCSCSHSGRTHSYRSSSSLSSSSLSSPSLSKYKSPILQRFIKLRLSPVISKQTHEKRWTLEEHFWDEYRTAGPTLILTGIPECTAAATGDGENAGNGKKRQLTFVNIQRKLRQRNVNLRHQYPSVYSQLIDYVTKGVHFPSQILFPVDAKTGRVFTCFMMPEAEAELEWMQSHHLLNDLDLSKSSLDKSLSMSKSVSSSMPSLSAIGGTSGHFNLGLELDTDSTTSRSRTTTGYGNRKIMNNGDKPLRKISNGHHPMSRSESYDHLDCLSHPGDKTPNHSSLSMDSTSSRPHRQLELHQHRQQHRGQPTLDSNSNEIELPNSRKIRNVACCQRELQSEPVVDYNDNYSCPPPFPLVLNINTDGGGGDMNMNNDGSGGGSDNVVNGEVGYKGEEELQDSGKEEHSPLQRQGGATPQYFDPVRKAKHVKLNTLQLQQQPTDNVAWRNGPTYLSPHHHHGISIEDTPCIKSHNKDGGKCQKGVSLKPPPGEPLRQPPPAAPAACTKDKYNAYPSNHQPQKSPPCRPETSPALFASTPVVKTAKLPPFIDVSGVNVTPLPSSPSSPPGYTTKSPPSIHKANAPTSVATAVKISPPTQQHSLPIQHTIRIFPHQPSRTPNQRTGMSSKSRPRPKTKLPPDTHTDTARAGVPTTIRDPNIPSPASWPPRIPAMSYDNDPIITTPSPFSPQSNLPLSRPDAQCLLSGEDNDDVYPGKENHGGQTQTPRLKQAYYKVGLDEDKARKEPNTDVGSRCNRDCVPASRVNLAHYAGHLAGFSSSSYRNTVVVDEADRMKRRRRRVRATRGSDSESFTAKTPLSFSSSSAFLLSRDDEMLLGSCDCNWCGSGLRRSERGGWEDGDVGFFLDSPPQPLATSTLSRDVAPPPALPAPLVLVDRQSNDCDSDSDKGKRTRGRRTRRKKPRQDGEGNNLEIAPHLVPRDECLDDNGGHGADNYYNYYNNNNHHHLQHHLRRCKLDADDNNIVPPESSPSQIDNNRNDNTTTNSTSKNPRGQLILLQHQPARCANTNQEVRRKFNTNSPHFPSSTFMGGPTNHAHLYPPAPHADCPRQYYYDHHENNINLLTPGRLYDHSSCKCPKTHNKQNKNNKTATTTTPCQELRECSRLSSRVEHNSTGHDQVTTSECRNDYYPHRDIDAAPPPPRPPRHTATGTGNTKIESLSSCSAPASTTNLPFHSQEEQSHYPNIDTVPTELAPFSHHHHHRQLAPSLAHNHHRHHHLRMPDLCDVTHPITSTSQSGALISNAKPHSTTTTDRRKVVTFDLLSITNTAADDRRGNSNTEENNNDSHDDVVCNVDDDNDDDCDDNSNNRNIINNNNNDNNNNDIDRLELDKSSNSSLPYCSHNTTTTPTTNKDFTNPRQFTSTLAMSKQPQQRPFTAKTVITYSSDW